jgi:hypothetical protein
LSSYFLCLDNFVFFLLLFFNGLPLNQGGDLITNRLSLNNVIFIPARGTVFKRSARFSLYHRVGHAHDLIRHPVSFLFVPVIGPADFEFRLNKGAALTTGTSAAARTDLFALN